MTLLLQNGRQRFYVMTIFSTLVFLIGLTAIYRPFLPAESIWGDIADVPLYQWVLCGFIALSVLLIVFSHSRMLAICALGTTGTGIALLFVIFSAPDVAMTQFMIEILVVIILTLVTLRLPVFHNYAPGFRTGRIRDGVIAILSGACVTVLMLSMERTPIDLIVSDYYGANSYTEAKGRNIVNVILVDFRAMDTLGEIVVVAIASLACFALIKLRRKNKITDEPGAAP
jgi:multicomponent Na+:H+ antiporter subunit A